MCLLCVEYQQNRLTLPEARRNFREMREGLSPDHAKEVQKWLRGERDKEHQQQVQARQAASKKIAARQP